MSAVCTNPTSTPILFYLNSPKVAGLGMKKPMPCCQSTACCLLPLMLYLSLWNVVARVIVASVRAHVLRTMFHVLLCANVPMSVPIFLYNVLDRPVTWYTWEYIGANVLMLFIYIVSLSAKHISHYIHLIDLWISYYSFTNVLMNLLIFVWISIYISCCSYCCGQ